MPYAALERILQPERFRQRAARAGGFSTPSLCFTAVEEDASPLLASNMRGTFLPTRRNAEGFAPFGFSYCPPGAEGSLIRELHRVLFSLSARERWPNRCNSPGQAVQYLRLSGVEPKSLVISESQLSAIVGNTFDLEEIRRMMALRGFVAVVDGMQVVLSDLPSGFALVTAAPTRVGVYTRVGDHVGLLMQRINRSLAVVAP